MKILIFMVVLQILILNNFNCQSRSFIENVENNREIVLTDRLNSIVSAYRSAVYSNEMKAGIINNAVSESNGGFASQNISLQIGINIKEKGQEPMITYESIPSLANFEINNINDLEAAKQSANSQLIESIKEKLRNEIFSDKNSQRSPRKLTDEEINNLIIVAGKQAKEEARIDLEENKRIREETDKARKPK